MKVAGCREALYPLCRPTELITLGTPIATRLL